MFLIESLIRSDPVRRRTSLLGMHKNKSFEYQGQTLLNFRFHEFLIIFNEFFFVAKGCVMVQLYSSNFFYFFWHLVYCREINLTLYMRRWFYIYLFLQSKIFFMILLLINFIWLIRWLLSLTNCYLNKIITCFCKIIFVWKFVYKICINI